MTKFMAIGKFSNSYDQSEVRGQKGTKPSVLTILLRQLHDLIAPNLMFYGFLEYISCNADMVNDVHWSVLGLDICCHDLVEL